MKSYAVVDERSVLAEGGLRHVLMDPITLGHEDTLTGSRSPQEDTVRDHFAFAR